MENKGCFTTSYMMKKKIEFPCKGNEFYRRPTIIKQTTTK